jgi:hypothetical protein
MTLVVNHLTLPVNELLLPVKTISTQKSMKPKMMKNNHDEYVVHNSGQCN